ncbi:MAG: PorT family protein [Bacteroidales bacterium]|nr:PorT family protein [Bacteroidales bacterium]
MKTLRTLAMLAALFCIGAQAQVKFGVAAELGPSFYSHKAEATEGGSSFSTTTKKSGFGWNVGAFADIPVGKLMLQPGVSFGMMSAKLDGDYSTTNTLINIPVMLGYPISIGSFKLRPELGPVLGLGLSWKEKENGTKIDDNLYEADEFKRFRFGLKFGAMFELNEHLAFGLHFDKGLNAQYDYEDEESETYAGYKYSYEVKEKGKWNFLSLRCAYTF